jgi:hypothetical protein
VDVLRELAMWIAAMAYAPATSRALSTGARWFASYAFSTSPSKPSSAASRRRSRGKLDVASAAAPSGFRFTRA